jgi:hypothetical protein
MGIITNDGGDKIKVNSKNINRNIKHLAQELSEMKIEEAGMQVPDPSDFLHQAPHNQDVRTTTPKKVTNNLRTIYMNREVAILKNNGGEFFVFYYASIDQKDFMDYAEVQMDYRGNDDDGQPDFDFDTENVEIDGDVINGYVNDNLDQLTKGQGLESFEKGDDLVKIDSELASELIRTYGAAKLGGILNFQQNENTTAGSVGGAFVAPLGMITRKIQESLEAKLSEGEELVIDEEEVAENTTSASSGSFVTPKVWAKDQANMRYAKKPVIPGGKFVEFDSCTKLNNHKSAQNGGCSTGAKDSVVKLKEGRIYEDLKLQHDKANSSLIVLSTLQGKDASNETFRNKNVLKQNGFTWNGKAWTIPADKLEIAKRTLSLVNKAEYLINTLEDIEEAVDGSGADNKDFMKSRLDQYITDLANATDEQALSAEVRRYLTFFSKFHNYSFYNRILIYIQRPESTRVASYKKWQEKFRQVRKDSVGITILAPVMSKVATPSPQAGGEPQPQGGDEVQSMQDFQNVTRFRAVKVFDIADTDPIDERGNVPDEPQWFADNTPSETADMLFNAVNEVAGQLGVDVTVDSSKKGEKGYSAGDHINLSSGVSGVGRLSTMVHELGHELMHWKEKSMYHIDNGPKGSSEHRELAELQAESVSYVVLKHYGLPVSHQSTYLALWKANKERILKNMEIISKVSQFIIEQIDKVVESNKK